MTAGIVVIGLGNPYRRDDGVGPAVATAVGRLPLEGVRVLTGIEDPMALLDAWSDAALAVVIDAALATRSPPGRVRSCTVAELAGSELSSHDVDIAAAWALGRALDRVPRELVMVTVDIADTGHGLGLTDEVAVAVPHAAAAVVAEIANSRLGQAT